MHTAIISCSGCHVPSDTERPTEGLPARQRGYTTLGPGDGRAGTADWPAEPRTALAIATTEAIVNPAVLLSSWNRGAHPRKAGGENLGTLWSTAVRPRWPHTGVRRVLTEPRVQDRCRSPETRFRRRTRWLPARPLRNDPSCRTAWSPCRSTGDGLNPVPATSTSWQDAAPQSSCCGRRVYGAARSPVCCRARSTSRIAVLR